MAQVNSDISIVNQTQGQICFSCLKINRF